jgi:hypothetical protein
MVIKDNVKKVPDLVSVFANGIWPYYEIPTDIILDHNKQVTSEFGSKLYQYLDIG